MERQDARFDQDERQKVTVEVSVLDHATMAWQDFTTTVVVHPDSRSAEDLAKRQVAQKLYGRNATFKPNAPESDVGTVGFPSNNPDNTVIATRASGYLTMVAEQIQVEAYPSDGLKYWGGDTSRRWAWERFGHKIDARTTDIEIDTLVARAVGSASQEKHADADTHAIYSLFVHYRDELKEDLMWAPEPE